MKRILISGTVEAKKTGMNCSYVNAVRGVGGVAAICYARDEADADALAEAFDALLMPGGNDLPGSYFGQEPHPTCNYDDPARDLSDKLLLAAFRKAGKRVLGICRGCQVANVFLGGTLHQHLPDAYDHPLLWHSSNYFGRHMATITGGSVLAGLIGAGEMPINSSHHQAIAMLGEGLTLCASAPDGVVEAAEGDNILLIQWHPEGMGPEMSPIFQWLIGAR